MSENYNYPDEFIKKLRHRIQKQIQGNAPQSIKIDLKVIDQGIDLIKGQTRYSLDCDVQTHSGKGQVAKGRVIKQGEMQREINAYLNGFSDEGSMTSTAKTVIKSLPLHGFGAGKQDIPLNDKKTVLSEQSTCGTCHGKKQINCSKCHGKKQIQCPKCYGTGYMKCIACNGNRTVIINGKRQNCRQCQGQGRVICTQCRGHKTIPCPSCYGKGSMTCHDCGGQGTKTSNTTITPSLKIQGDILIDEMAPHPKNMVGKIGAQNLAKGGHIQVNMVSNDTDNDDQNQNDNIIHYQSKMPWAVVQFMIGKTPYKVHLAGSKGAIASSGHFMDDILDNGITKLEKAASGEGYINGLLKDATRYALIKDLLSQLIKTNHPKKTMVGIHKKYNLGLSKQITQKMIKNSLSALKRVTRLPRYIGMAVGFGASALINYYWFMNNGMTMVALPPSIPPMIAHGIPLMVSMGVAFAMTKMAGYMTYQSLLKQLEIKQAKMPIAGTAGIYALIGSLIIWGAFLVQSIGIL